MSEPYKKCPNCGASLPEESVFCRECGTKLYIVEESPAPKPVTRRNALKYIITAVAAAAVAGIGGLYIGQSQLPAVITKTVEKTVEKIVPYTITATLTETRTVTDVIEVPKEVIKEVTREVTVTAPGVTVTQPGVTKEVTLTAPAPVVTVTQTVIVTPTPTPTPTVVLTITTYKTNYIVGEELSVRGTAAPDAMVSIQVFDPAGTRKAIAQAKAAADGTYIAWKIYVFTGEDPAGTWTVEAYQGGVSARAFFTLAG